ncbi:MAG: sulfatase-like hydrolase/transferase [Acidobacteria bacterium]|nr:sulfatase-like hydrolase/transferase [Acidobacteriota bacterium]
MKTKEWILILLAGMLAFASGCGQTNAGFNVVLISIDTLRPDHLGCYGYGVDTSPTIDRLAAEGVRFENAFSSTTWTLPAHVSLLTGMPDGVHGVTSEASLLDENRDTLAEIMRRTGRHTLGVFTGPYLLPFWGFHQGFDTYADATRYDKTLEGAEVISAAEKGRTTPDALDRVEALLADISGRPFFLFLHLFDAHPDFDPPPPYDTRFDPGYSGSVTGIDIMNNPSVHAAMPERDRLHLQALYDGEIRFINDRGLDRLLGILEARQCLENTLIVLTSDHGEEFFEHGVFGHRQNLYDTTLRIPLIVWAPALVPSGVTVKTPVRIYDILPTILELTEVPRPDGILGRSLVPLFSEEAVEGEWPSLFAGLESQSRKMEALRTERYKMVVDFKNDVRALFDLQADPEEKAPLTDRSLPLFLQFQDMFFKQRWELTSIAENLPKGPVRRRDMDPELRERLRSLGYIK